MSCPEWCSPVDIEGSVLSNVGFALFLILSFRAADVVDRYEEGARTIYAINLNLKALAVEAVQSFSDGFLHTKDKERIVAHIVEIPLHFRDQLLGSKFDKENPLDSLLSQDDKNILDNKNDQIDYLLKVIQAYYFAADMPGSSRPLKDADPNLLPEYSGLISETRVSRLRVLFAQITSAKQFPVVGSYKRHQYMFSALWLALLPFSVTKQTGYFTIHWASLISYGVLALEGLAQKFFFQLSF